MTLSAQLLRSELIQLKDSIRVILDQGKHRLTRTLPPVVTGIISICTLNDVEMYKRVKAAHPEKVTLDLPWNELPPDIKEALRQQVEEA